MATTSAGERLTDIILSNRMTKKNFSKALGYNPSYITQICLNIKQPSQEFAAKVEKFFGVPATWLIYGEDEESQPSSFTSPIKDAVITKVNQMSSDDALRAVLAFINCYDELPKIPAMKTKTIRQVRLNEHPKLYKVPIKGTVAGGSPIIAYEEKDDFVETPIYADSALYISGKSMEPDYPDGSMVLVKENAYVSNGDVIIALIMREAEIAEATCKIINKRKGKVALTSINPDFEPQYYDGEDGCEIKIFGKVIGKYAER